MVKVLLTGSQHPAPSGQVAVGRLQEMGSTRGTYQIAPVTEASVDTVIFTHRKPDQPSNGILQESRRHLPTAGLILAGTLLGGLLGGGLPGAIAGGLTTTGVLSALHFIRNRNTESTNSVAPVTPVSEVRNPFQLTDLDPGATDAVSPRELAKARLHDDLSVILTDAQADELQAELEAFLAEKAQMVRAEIEAETEAGKTSPHFGQIAHNGRTYAIRNIAYGMLPAGFNVFSGEQPSLKFRAIRQAAPQIDQPTGSVMNNVVEPMAVVTLSRDAAVVNTFNPAENPVNGFHTSSESVFWG